MQVDKIQAEVDSIHLESPLDTTTVISIQFSNGVIGFFTRLPFCLHRNEAVSACQSAHFLETYLIVNHTHLTLFMSRLYMI